MTYCATHQAHIICDTFSFTVATKSVTHRSDFISIMYFGAEVVNNKNTYNITNPAVLAIAQRAIARIATRPHCLLSGRPIRHHQEAAVEPGCIEL